MFEAILSQADRSPNRAVIFIIQSRVLKVCFLVFKKSVPEYDNQFINKFHQICCIKLPEFRGHGTSIICSTYENDGEILYSFEVLNDSQLKFEVKDTEVLQNIGKYLPNDTE
jgi:hypothetical protein